VTLAVPAAVAPWNVTEQLALVERMHVVELREPPVVPADKVKVTVPDGVLPVLSAVTAARQVEVCPGRMELGLHDTAVTVSIFARETVMVAEVALALPLCVVSPP
jgi:hypothetical protein